MERLGMRFVRKVVVDGLDTLFYAVDGATWRKATQTE
jgi:hypothetical protein